MRVDGNRCLAEHHVENDVCRLASDSRKRFERGAIPGNLARVLRDELTRKANEILGLHVVKADAFQIRPHAIDAEVRVYENLFISENPDDVPEGQDFTANLNPKSLEIVTGAKLEPSLAGAEPGSRYQFERLGYFSVDPDSAVGKTVFNRTVALRDTWAKIEKKSK